MVRKLVSREEAIYAVTAAHSAVWHAIAGFRYMWDAHDRGAPFELTIFEDLIATKPFAGLAIDWRYTVYPERLRERAQEVVKYTARQAIVDVHDAVWWYGMTAGLARQYSENPVVVLLRALRHAYSHRADDWDFGGTPLPMQWRHLSLEIGMGGKSVSQSIFLSDQLYLINDAIFLLDPGSALAATVHR